MRYLIDRWRSMGAGHQELRLALRASQLEAHNQRVSAANNPRRGLNYEHVADLLTKTAQAVIESKQFAPRPYAPAADDESRANARAGGEEST